MDTTNKKPSILVVDDTAANLDILVSLLQKDYRVGAARNGQKALDMVAKKPPDLILLDIMMPEMDGYEVCRRLKADDNTRDIPIIFLSALSETLDKVKAFDVGGVDYITKPFETAEVLARVETQLALRRYTQEIQQYSRLIYQTFGRYMSEEIVQTILDTPDGMCLGGAEQSVTIIMSDIRGFTAMCERLSAEQVIAMLNQYFDVMTDIILRYEGTIDAFIGDAILVVFGAPFQYSDDAQRAVACAIEMQLAMPAVQRRNREAGYPEFDIGIGIHTGEVVVGNMGSHKRMKYGILGHNVNLAARAESYTTGGQILVSADTYAACQELLQVEQILEVMPKGVTEALTLYDIRGIGGEFNVFLPAKTTLQLITINPPINIRFTILAGKHASSTSYTGQIVQLGEKHALIQSTQACQALTNLKISVYDAQQRCVSHNLYAKVIDESVSDAVQVSFTSIPAELKVFFQTYFA